MPRRYRKVKGLEAEVFVMKEAGKTNQEIANHYDLSLSQIKGLIKRKNRRQEKIEAGIPLRKQGRQPKGQIKSEQAKDSEIKRLKMENELLRDFLRHAGRR